MVWQMCAPRTYGSTSMAMITYCIEWYLLEFAHQTFFFWLRKCILREWLPNSCNEKHCVFTLINLLITLIKYQKTGLVSFAFGSSSPTSLWQSTTSLWPMGQAIIRGVHPSLAFALNRNSTTSVHFVAILKYWNSDFLNYVSEILTFCLSV